MPALNNKLIESKIKIEEYLRIRVDSKNISALEEYNKAIGKIAKKIRSINLIKEALEKNIITDIESSSQIKLKQSLNSFMMELKNGNIDKFSLEYLQYTSPIHEHISTIENEYKDIWKHYYNQNYKSSINLLDTLETILKDTEIIRIRNNISKVGNKWPINIRDLEELQINSERAYKKIKDLNLNDNIQLFLEKLLDNQIRLSDIDNEIYRWLKNNKLDNKIKLKI